MPPAAPLAESPVVKLILPVPVPVDKPVDICTAPLAPEVPALCVDRETPPLVNLFERPDKIVTDPPVAPNAEPDSIFTSPPTPLFSFEEDPAEIVIEPPADCSPLVSPAATVNAPPDPLPDEPTSTVMSPPVFSALFPVCN